MLNPLRLVRAPAPVLNQVASEVDLDDTSESGVDLELIEIGRARYPVLAVVSHMQRLMSAKGGIGLAANQVGLLKRIIVIDGALARLAGIPWALINPSFVPFEDAGQQDSEEGCLSYPGVRRTVRRWRRGNLGWTVDGHSGTVGRCVRTVDVEQHGLAVIVAQHEIDHLSGRCLIGEPAG